MIHSFLPKKLTNLIGLFCLLLSLPLWAAIMVAVEPTITTLDGQVRLSLTYDPHLIHGLPDLSPLQDNFTILETQHNMSYRIINGQTEASTQWQIVLQPKKTGVLLIPQIHIGQESSPPLQLTVTSGQPSNRQTIAGSLPSAPTDVAKLTAVVSPLSSYLHQEVLYTVQLWSQQPLMNVQYRHPTIEDAIILPLGEGRQFQREVAGVLYHVDEQRYAIFPQKSGKLPITPPKLRAMVYTIPPQALSLQAKMLELNVRPLPPHVSMQNWLPSKLVRLRESYDKPNLKLSQGTTIVRTVQLQAQGLVAKLLPKLPIKEQAGFRVYAGKAETDNNLEQGELWGTMTQKLSYVVTKPGELSLPAIKVPWFNVITEQMEIAELPARTLHITMPQSTQKKRAPKHKPPAQLKQPSASLPAPWLIISVIVFGILLLGGYAKQKKTHRLYRDLRTACCANDAALTQRYVLDWIKQLFPKETCLGLTDIGHLTGDKNLQEQLSRLNHCLYQSQSPPWTGAALWQAIKNYRHKKHVRSQNIEHLPPINPQGIV